MGDAPDRSWMVRAACRGMGPDSFFLEAHDQVGPRRAYEVCESCEVRIECLNYVGQIDYDQARFGIWGGLSPKARRNHPEVRLHVRPLHVSSTSKEARRG